MADVFCTIHNFPLTIKTKSDNELFDWFDCNSCSWLIICNDCDKKE